MDNNEDEMDEEMFKKLISEHEKELEDSGNKRHDDRKKQACWCCGDSTHRKSECPNRERAFCNRCNTRGHFDKACTRRGAGQKRLRSATPTGAEQANKRSSQGRPSTSETTSSRRSAEDSGKVNITTKRAACKQSRRIPQWEGITPEGLYKAGRLEHKMKMARSSERQTLKKLHCNIFKGRRPPVPSIPCIAHKTRKSSKGRDVVVTPDTGATMTIIP